MASSLGVVEASSAAAVEPIDNVGPDFGSCGGAEGAGVVATRSRRAGIWLFAVSRPSRAIFSMLER